MSTRQGVLNNLSKLTAGQIAAQLLNLWVFVYLANTLTDHWFGVIQQGVLFMGFAMVFAEWGMMSLGIRETSRLDNPAQLLKYARQHMGLLMIQALAVFALGLALIPHLPFEDTDPWVLRLYLCMVLVQMFMVSWVAIGTERMTWVGITKSFRSLLYAALILPLLLPLSRTELVPTAYWVPILFLVANVMGNLLIGIVLRRHFSSWITPLLPSMSEIRRRWREATALGASVVVLKALLLMDLFILSWLTTPAVVGNYAAGRVVINLVVAIQVLWSALLPRLSRLAKFDESGFRSTFNAYLGFVLVGLLPIALGGILLGPELMELIYGDKYPVAGSVFRILAVSYTCLGLGMFLGNTLVAQDRQQLYLPPVLACTLLAGLGSWFLIPRLGAEGAAWGMLIAHGTLAIVLAVILRHLFSRTLGALLLKVILALLAMAAGVLLTASWPVIPRIILGALIYGMTAGWWIKQYLGLARAGHTG